MAQVVILGGYGRVGRLCAQEVAAQTRASLVIAGPSIQKAESVALGLGRRATGAYGNAADPRTLSRILDGASVLVACTCDLSPAVLELAIGMRVAVVAVSTLSLSPVRQAAIAEQAWRAQVPVVIHAGAVPGLPGVLAELLVRRFPALAEIRIASTGPWTGTPGAARDVQRSASERPTGMRLRPPKGIRLPQRFAFEAPIGSLAMRPSVCADLEGFAAAHCVERLSYLEPVDGLLRLAMRPAPRSFAIGARGWVGGTEGPPDARIDLHAGDALLPAAALAGALVAGALARELPAGLLTPREARGPGALLADLEKRGVGVRNR
jgi:hypothetical protein